MSCRLRHGVLGTGSQPEWLGIHPCNAHREGACLLLAARMLPLCCLFRLLHIALYQPWHNSSDNCIVAVISILVFRPVAVTPSGFVIEGNKPHVTRPVYKGFSPSPWGHKHMTDQQITL